MIKEIIMLSVLILWMIVGFVATVRINTLGEKHGLPELPVWLYVFGILSGPLAWITLETTVKSRLGD